MIAERLRVYSQDVSLEQWMVFVYGTAYLHHPGTINSAQFWMHYYAALLLLCLAGFLIGSIPFGWIVARLRGIDITKHGSGNVGMTNVWRVLGWQAGLLVLVLDAAKGFAPTLFVRQMTNGAMANYPCMGTFDTAVPVIVGLAAILGHTFSPWLRFKGGKGVATGLGVLIALFQWWVLVPLGAFILVLLTSRMVSAGSISAAIALIATSAYLDSVRDPTHPAGSLLPFGILVALLVIYNHRSNIRRIMNGTENKVSFGRKTAS